MKNFLLFCLLLIYPSKITEPINNTKINTSIIVYQINSEWNKRNTIKNLEYLKGCKYVFGYLEDQPEKFRKEIKSVPAIFITKNDNIVFIYQAGISLKPEIQTKEIQEIVNKHI